MTRFWQVKKLVAVPAMLLAGVCLLAPASPATAASPAWSVTSIAQPTVFEAGDHSGMAHFLVRATNVGGVAPNPAQPITITDVLPAGVSLAGSPALLNPDSTAVCTGTTTIACTVTLTPYPETSSSYPNSRISPPLSLDIVVPVNVDASPGSTLINSVSVEGGGALPDQGEGLSPVGPVGSAAPFGVARFDGEVTDADGLTVTQAAAHPFAMSAQIDFNGVTEPVTGASTPSEDVKDIAVELPPGMVANPTAVPTCSAQQLSATICPFSSQVGVVTFSTTGSLPTSAGTFAPLYNMATGPGMPALFGFVEIGSVVLLEGRLRRDVQAPGGYVAAAEIHNVPQTLPLNWSNVSLWGVPSDPLHDSVRYKGGQGADPWNHPGPAPSLPFLTSPSDCSAGPLKTAITASSWQRPGVERSASFLSHRSDGTPTGVSGCDRVPFDPTLTAKPSGTVAGAPSGLTVSLHLPQAQDPEGLAEGNLKKAVVTLPQGVAVSPPAADGLEGCSVAQIDLAAEGAGHCPDAAKIGSVEIDTPLLDRPLPGAVYLARQGENPFGSLLALYLVVNDPKTGVALKMPGKVEANEQTGQLVATFDNNPQLPFEDLRLSLFGGPKAALQMPSACGTYTTRAQLTSWSSEDPVESVSRFAIDRNCAAASQFTPSMEAGVTNPVAGKGSAFVLNVSRPDGQQNISRLSATLPEGLLAKLAGVPLCADAQAATGACPQGSQVGTMTVAVGAGSSPLNVPQPGKAPTAVYLGGPYKGGPYSLVVKVPAQAGPFDLGTVAVRAALQIDPRTAQVTAASDSLPQILKGIPISYQKVNVAIDRQGFVQNPTSCDPTRVTSTITSSAGTAASPSSRFQVAGCERLAFKPKLALRLSGAPTHRGGHPKLQATLTMPKGGANIARAQVTLPKTEYLENAHIRTICTRVQYAAKVCPAKSIYGYAKAWSPLLDKPLEGPVYLRSSSHKLPDLVASLDGQIHIDLQGRIDSKDSRIRNTFEAVPDAPITKFQLTMQGGKKGLLVNGTELCKTTPRATALFDAQNGKTHDIEPVAKVAGCGKKGKK